MQLRLNCHVDSTSTISGSLVSQIDQLIESGQLAPGSRLPSIRDLAEQNAVSRFTVVQVYDRLVAKGLLESRRGSGFYVADTSSIELVFDETDIKPSNDAGMISDNAGEAQSWLSCSSGHLPGAWLGELQPERFFRSAARHLSDETQDGYSDLKGYLPLRKTIHQRLLRIGLTGVDLPQIITTSGTLPAIDMLCRTLLERDSCVLVDDPGYYMTNRLLQNLNVKIIGIPWTQEGPDLHALETLAAKHNPKLFISSAVCQSPTNVTLSPAIIHRVLAMAEKYNFLIIEDDIYGLFDGDNATRYATLDQIHRVIYVNSYSKTISGKLRVGYMVLPQTLIDDILITKSFGGRASEFSERILYEILVSGSYRKHISHLIERLEYCREKAIKLMEKHGLEIFSKPKYGMYLWVRFPQIDDCKIAMRAAKSHQIRIMNGRHFCTNEQTVPWFRLSVAWCLDPRLDAFLAEFTATHNPQLCN